MIQIDKQAIYKYHGYVFQHFSILSEELLKQILDWRNTFEIRQFMYNTDVISLENHLNFTKTLAQREDCYYWLVTKDNVPYGVFNLTNIDHERRIAELGYYMAPSQMKSGGGLDFVYTIICFSFEVAKCTKLVGSIDINNTDALLLDEFLGFVLGDTVESDGCCHNRKFIEWELSELHYRSITVYRNDIRKLVRFIRDKRK